MIGTESKCEFTFRQLDKPTILEISFALFVSETGFAKNMELFKISVRFSDTKQYFLF